MDILSHFFLPLITIYAVNLDVLPDHHLFLLGFLGILADFDILLGIHRFYLHSPLLVSLLIFPFLLLVKDKKKRKYFLLSAYFLYSHILLDFFTGGVPLFWPISQIAIGIEFSFTVALGSSISLEKVGIDLIITEPTTITYGHFSLITGPGVISAILYCLVISKEVVKKLRPYKRGEDES